MKNKIRYLILLSTLAGIITSCKNSDVRLPLLKETYALTDKNPFGGYIAYKQLEVMYKSNVIRQKKQPFNKTWKNEIFNNASLYVCITPSLVLNEKDIEAMLDYVNAGNDLFIAAGYIDDLLLDKIECKEMYHPVINQSMFDLMTNTSTKTIINQAHSFSYYYLPYENYFFDIKKSDIKILGYNESNYPNFIVYFYGKGRLFLHCDPHAFSNYFLLKNNNYRYFQNVLSYTIAQPEHLYWDDYYNKYNTRKDKSNSALGEILRHPPLAYAFWLSILLLLLYVLFGGKRKQRIVKQLKPNENTTVTFAETIGRLYLQKKDNKNIADKIVTYFNESVRNSYFLNTNNVNEDFIVALSRKSGVQKDKVESLYRQISYTHNRVDIDDYQLLSLNEQIQYFYKNRN